MVIPMILNIRTMRMRIPRAMDLPRTSPLFGRKRHRPSATMTASTASAAGISFQSARPTVAEVLPASGNSDR